VSAKGSAPIETVALITLLLLPIGPAVLLYEQLSNQLAAESIARHGVRAAMLNAPLGGFSEPGVAVGVLARAWQKQVSSYRVSAQGELITLEVRVGNASAIATLGREPQR
jgi:hypothetical protein